MRFKEFLQEDEMSFEQLIKAIARDCKPYLETNPRPLYRGVDVKHLKPGFTPHPEGREARDSSPWFNFMFNAGIQLSENITAVRRRAVFATGYENIANDYGKTAFFFPAGDFGFLWSKFISDSYDEQTGILINIADNFKKLTDLDVPDAGLHSAIELVFRNLADTTKPHAWIKDSTLSADEDTQAAAAAAAEDYTLAVLTGVPDLRTKLLEALRQSFEFLYLNIEELRKATLSGHEIIFYKTDGYYLVPTSSEQFAGINDDFKAFQFLLDKIKNAPVN